MKWIVFLVTISMSSCKAREVAGESKSNLLTSDLAFFSAPRVRAEYLPSSAVIVSSELFLKLKRYDIASTLLKTGISKLIVLVPQGQNPDIASETWADMRKTLGPHTDQIAILPLPVAGRLGLWARDWSPLTAASSNKLGESNKSILIDQRYFNDEDAGDSSAGALSDYFRLPVVDSPIYSEGGNFMISGSGDCMITKRTLRINIRKRQPTGNTLDEGQIRELYKRLYGCTRLTIFPEMPNEMTGHIDIWAKLLNDSTVVIGSLSDSTIETMNGPLANQRTDAKEMKTYLEARAADFERLGYSVVRIPMPAPIPDRGLVFSFLNSVILNGVVVMPVFHSKPNADFLGSKYAAVSFDFPDRDLQKDYESQAIAAYSSVGYKVEQIDSTELALRGGAMHCVTMQFGIK
jgi:agmatine/peptidylarginine deiminase